MVHLKSHVVLHADLTGYFLSAKLLSCRFAIRIYDECISDLCAGSSDVCCVASPQVLPCLLLQTSSFLSVLSFTPEVLELACGYTNALLALMGDVSPAAPQETSRTRTRHVKNDTNIRFRDLYFYYNVLLSTNSHLAPDSFLLCCRRV